MMTVSVSMYICVCVDVRGCECLAFYEIFIWYGPTQGHDKPKDVTPFL